MKQTFAILLVAALSLTTNAQSKTRTVKLRVIETTDVHGSFFPYDFINRCPKAGSLARVSTYVDSLRHIYGKNLLLLDNGDILQGQPTCYYYNYVNTKAKNVAAEVVNYMCYDAETMGNHDVEVGHAVYDKWISEVHCPLLGANIINTATGQPYVKPYAMFERDGVRIAVIGMITPAIPNWLTKDLWSGLRFDEMVSTARHWMQVVRGQEHADVVIGLFHSGASGGIVTPQYEEDASLRVAREVPGFNLILFGHDHTRHHETIVNTEGHPVLCLDPANNAMAVADAEIEITKEHNTNISNTPPLVRVIGRLADVRGLKVDKTFMQHFQPQIAEIHRFVDRPIGTFKNAIYTRERFFGNSAFNDFILNLQLKITGADISFNAPLQFNAKIGAGTVRVSDMFNLYKFENQLYVMKLTGKEIRRHLEMSYDLWVNTMKSANDHLLKLDLSKGDNQHTGFKNFTFNFDSAAGIDYEVDVTQPDGQKVHILRMSNGQPFQEDKMYKVALNSYRANGGGELLTKGAGIPKDSLEQRIIYRSERDQRYYLMQEIEKQGIVDPQPNHNWRFVPEAWTRPAAARDFELLFGHHNN